MATDALVTYLNDHLAGSTAALQLLDHLVEESDAGENRKFFTTLRAEIAEDRGVLEDLVRRIGDHPSAFRTVGGWLAEWFGRLKLKLDDPSGDSVAELEALEVLLLGIHGKQALWDALVVVAAAVPSWADVNFARLAQRAADQTARVEARRLDAVRRLVVAET
jgi:hypothetical protein